LLKLEFKRVPSFLLQDKSGPVSVVGVGAIFSTVVDDQGDLFDAFEGYGDFFSSVVAFEKWRPVDFFAIGVDLKFD